MAKKKNTKRGKKVPSQKKESPKGGKGTSQKKKSGKKGTSEKKRSEMKVIEESDLKTISKQLARIERNLDDLQSKVGELKDTSKTNVKRTNSLEKRLDTRVKREEMMMTALGFNSRTKKGGRGTLNDINLSILKVEEYLLNTGNRIDNILSAVKNHREFLVKLNKRVYKVDTKERIRMELDVMGNRLSIMMLNGFDFDKSLIRDIDRVKKMMEKKDMEIRKLKTRMDRLDRKFEDEMERFDFASVYNKKKDIPGYR